MGVSAIKHITVAIDESPASEAAVRYSCELARVGAALSFCSVSANAHATTDAGMHQPDALATPQRAAEICAAAVGQARALGIKADRQESPLHLAEAVVGCAREHSSEVIVIGNEARHGFLHLRESIGERLMRIADRPVIFVHEADRYRDGDIAVTVSGYDTSHVVLDAAIAIATLLGRNLFLISEIVIPVGEPYYAPGSNAEAQFTEAAKRASAAGVKSASAMGDGVGSIPSSLIELAERRDCAMIVTGIHDHSGIERFFNGSIAQQLLLEAHVPVAVVHHAFQPEPD